MAIALVCFTVPTAEEHLAVRRPLQTALGSVVPHTANVVIRQHPAFDLSSGQATRILPKPRSDQLPYSGSVHHQLLFDWSGWQLSLALLGAVAALVLARFWLRGAASRTALFSTTGPREEARDGEGARALPIKPGTGLSLATRLQLDTIEDLTPEMKEAARRAAERVQRHRENLKAIEARKKAKRTKQKYRIIELSWDEMEEREKEKDDEIRSLSFAQSTGYVDADTYRQNYEAYQKLKQELSTLTATFAAVGAVTAFVLYGKDTGISAAIGGVGGLIYSRLLARKAEDDKGAPTLLIPAALFALTVSWKKYAGPERFGVDLQLLPVIAGFLSYRLSGVAVGIRDLFQSDQEAKALQEQRAREEAAAAAVMAAEATEDQSGEEEEETDTESGEEATDGEAEGPKEHTGERAPMDT
eukprot:EG_transcript_12971